MKPILGIFLAALLVGCGSGDENDDATVDLTSIEGSPNCSSIQGLRTNTYGGETLDSTRRGSAAQAQFDTTYSYDCFLGVYKYDVAAEQEIIGTVSVPEDKDYDFYFYNAAGERVASSTNEGKGVAEAIDYTVTASDSTPLYVVVYDQLASSESDFELLLRGSTVVSEQEDNDTKETAQLLNGTYVTVTGATNTLDDQDDYFKIPVSEGKVISITLGSSLEAGEDIYATLSSTDESTQFAQAYIGNEGGSEAEFTDTKSYTVTAGTSEVLIWVNSIFQLSYSFTIDIADAEATDTN